jgi:beta propeller repeat protein
VASQNITGVVDKNQSNLSWDKNTSTNFDHYEIYRSNVSGGTENPATRTTVATINDQNVTNFSDQNLPAGNYYYKIATFYKNGMMAYSNEFSLEIKREITKITMTNADQRQPFIYEGKIYWQDTPNGGTNSTGGLYSYDMKSGKVEVKNISNCGVKFPYSPTGNDGKIVFYGNTGNTYGTEVCYYNLTTNTFLPISLSPLPKEQWYPTITDSGLIIWEDNRPGNFDLYFLDPAKSNGPEVFVSAFGQQINPRTWGNKVIWKDNRSNGNYDIFMKDLSGGSETKVAENAGDDFADIWDKYIVWDFRGKLYLKNYETGETKTLHETGVGYNPRVRDGKVAYTLVEGNTSYIHIYDIATGKDLKIDFPLNFQSNLFVSQAYLAFDSANKATPWDFDIYLTQL